MSGQVVREAFRQKIAGLLTAEGFEFIESINKAESTKELPLRWYTLGFATLGDTRVSLGTPTLFRESGIVTVSVFTEHNIQDADAVEAAEIIRAALANWTTDDGHTHVLQAEPPADMDGGDFRGSFYGISVDLPYTSDRFAS